MLKKTIIALSLALFVFTAGIAIADAATGGVLKLQENLTGFGKNTGLGDDADLATKIASIINIVLGFVGLLSTIIIIYAGFRWMTASGNEEQIKEAKGNIRNAVIGIVVVLLSFTIINFVVSRVSEETGAGGGGGGGGGGDVINEPIADPAFTPNPAGFNEAQVTTYKYCDVGVPSFFTLACDARFTVCSTNATCEAIDQGIPGVCTDTQGNVQNTQADKDNCRATFVSHPTAIHSGG